MRVAPLIAALVIAAISPPSAAAGPDENARPRGPWPAPAVRSGTRLPPPRTLALSIEGAGAYVPEVAGVSPAKSGVGRGRLIWNLALWERVGLFGRHDLGAMWWRDVTLLVGGHELGLRYVASDHVTLEAAYLGHRTERQWVDGHGTAIGGVRDHGVELSGWAAFEPHRRLRIGLHLIGRWFRVYRDDQGVAGAGLRLSLLPVDRHAIVLELTALRVVRRDPRAGVERATVNLLGDVLWRSELAGSFGVHLGARVTTHLLVGEVPMLELKRSMIDEPMALGIAGVSFDI